MNDEEYDEPVAYKEMNDFIEEHFLRTTECGNSAKSSITNGCLSKDDPHCGGSKYNVLIKWETGECAWEPTDLLNLDDHKVDPAIYAHANRPLELPGWKQYKKLAKQKKKLDRMVKQAKL